MKYIWLEKPTVFSFTSFFSGILLFVVACFTFWFFIGTPFLFVAFIELVVAVLSVGIAVKRARLTLYTVSRYGVCREQQWLPYSMYMIVFSKIADVSVSYGVLGRFFCFGMVTVHSGCVSCSSLVLTGVRSPEALRRLIIAKKESFQ